MKKYLVTVIVLAFLVAPEDRALAGEDAVSLSVPYSKDTVEIQFGDRSRIVIQVDGKEDLEMLRSYDINKMLEDIRISVEEAGDSTEILIIEDPEGRRYQSGEEDAEFRELEDIFSSRPDQEPFATSSAAGEEEGGIDDMKEGTWYSDHRTNFSAFFDFGMNNYTENGAFPDANDAQYTVRPWGSWYVALQPGWQTHLTGKLALQYGAGVSWYNFKFQDASTRVIKGENGVIFDQWDPELKASKSKLTIAHINAYLVPLFDFGYRKHVRTMESGATSRKIQHRNRGFRIGAGGYIGYRIDSYTKLVNRESGSKDKSRDHNSFYLENIRYGTRVLIGFGEVDFFLNYDLHDLFAEDRGPQLNAFSFGLSF